MSTNPAAAMPGVPASLSSTGGYRPGSTRYADEDTSSTVQPAQYNDVPKTTTPTTSGYGGGYGSTTQPTYGPQPPSYNTPTSSYGTTGYPATATKPAAGRPPTSLVSR